MQKGRKPSLVFVVLQKALRATRHSSCGHVLIDAGYDSVTFETGKNGILEFFHIPLTPSFTPRRYIEYIKAAKAEGVEVTIIYSLSHAWSGSGGMLDIHDNATKA